MKRTRTACLIALVFLGALAFAETSAACSCRDGRDCRGRWLEVQPCGTRVCGGDLFWYNCSGGSWIRESNRCTCPSSLSLSSSLQETRESWPFDTLTSQQGSLMSLAECQPATL